MCLVLVLFVNERQPAEEASSWSRCLHSSTEEQSNGYCITTSWPGCTDMHGHKRRSNAYDYEHNLDYSRYLHSKVFFLVYRELHIEIKSWLRLLLNWA